MHNCFLEENVPSRRCCTNDSISWIDRHHPLVAQHRAAWGPPEALKGEMQPRTRVTVKHDNMAAQTPTPLCRRRLPRHRTDPNCSPTLLTL